MARTDLPRGTVTFLFTDVEGSTRLLHRLGPSAYAHALTEHRTSLRAAFAEADGIEVDTQGDAFFVAFATAAGAAAAASGAHAALEGGPLRVRIGIHTGTPDLVEEGYVGEDVHRGARIAALAHGGQTLLSSTTAALLEGAELRDLGHHRLKDFEGTTRVFQLGGRTFPPLRTPGSVALPTPATPFLGRQRELLDAISIVLERDPRVLTVVGPGGTGKTRFAIELARLLADEADGGTVFVPLAPLRDAELVVAAVGERLGATTPEPESVAARVRGRTHVVADNLEHLLPDAAGQLAHLVAAAPALRLLVTSREALRIEGETRFELPSMVEDEAVELFLARARSVGPAIERTPAIEELCERLDRLPLAVELAAARTNLLSPEALLDRLGRRLDLLRGTRDADPRHATLRATIAWSHDLLSAGEQRLFARMSVFAAGCTLETAEAVCEADLFELESLLDKSLIRRRTGRLGEGRFWMLETIREFAAERLDELGEVDVLLRRVAERMLEIARSANLTDDLHAKEQHHELVLAEQDDVRAAADWAAEHDVELGLRLVVALENHLVHDPLDGARRVGALLERADGIPAELRAAALRVHGGTLYRSGNFERGAERARESLEAYRELGDERGVLLLTGRLAVDEGYRGEPARARELAEEMLERSRALGAPRLEAEALGTLATVSQREGDLETAYELCERSAATAASCGFVWWQANMLSNVLEIGLGLGRLDDAERAGVEALRLAIQIEERLSTVWTLTGLARIALERGDLERAGRLWGAVEADSEREPLPQGQLLAEFAAPLGVTSDPAFASAREQGRSIDLETAIEQALGAQTFP